jgi:hypothetical protein
MGEGSADVMHVTVPPLISIKNNNTNKTTKQTNQKGKPGFNTAQVMQHSCARRAGKPGFNAGRAM